MKILALRILGFAKTMHYIYWWFFPAFMFTLILFILFCALFDITTDKIKEYVFTHPKVVKKVIWFVLINVILYLVMPSYWEWCILLKDYIK